MREPKAGMRSAKPAHHLKKTRFSEGAWDRILFKFFCLVCLAGSVES